VRSPPRRTRRRDVRRDVRRGVRRSARRTARRFAGVGAGLASAAGEGGGIDASAGALGAGTRFVTAGIVRRYAKTARRSSSVICAYLSAGIGGSNGRPRPWWRPARIVSMKVSSVHAPRPVSTSGVRFAENDVPHGPLHAVSVPVVVAIHGPSGSVGAGGTSIGSGWPASHLDRSSRGPFGPIVFDVWQSAHTPTVTR